MLSHLITLYLHWNHLKESCIPVTSSFLPWISYELLWHQCYKSQDSHADSSLIVDKPVSTSLKSDNRIQNLVLRLNVLYTMSLPRMKSFRSRCWCDRLTYFYLFFHFNTCIDILLNLLLHLSAFSFSKDWNCLHLRVHCNYWTVQNIDTPFSTSDYEKTADIDLKFSFIFLAMKCQTISVYQNKQG